MKRYNLPPNHNSWAVPAVAPDYSGRHRRSNDVDNYKGENYNAYDVSFSPAKGMLTQSRESSKTNTLFSYMLLCDGPATMVFVFAVSVR